MNVKKPPLLWMLPCAALPLLVLAQAAPDRDALRRIVQEQCAVHWQQARDPAPCERVGDGVAVLHDRKGGAHFLLIPTRTLAGMESPELFEPGTPNYFAAAWRARDRIAAVVGHEVPRGAVGMAMNPQHARTQDQLHIHIECVRPDVAAVLRSAAGALQSAWSPIAIDGVVYQALRIMGGDLEDANPIELLAQGLPGARSAMGRYTLVVVGMDFKDGPGFAALAGTGPAGELLLDSSCAVARGF